MHATELVAIVDVFLDGALDPHEDPLPVIAVEQGQEAVHRHGRPGCQSYHREETVVPLDSTPPDVPVPDAEVRRLHRQTLVLRTRAQGFLRAPA